MRLVSIYSFVRHVEICGVLVTLLVTGNTEKYTGNSRSPSMHDGGTDIQATLTGQ